MGARRKLAAEAAAETLDLFGPVHGAGQDGTEREMRLSSQRDTILALLRKRGELGITNLQLNEVCLRYGARIFELRQMGHEVETRLEGEGIFRFILKTGSEPGLALPSETQRPGMTRSGSQMPERQKASTGRTAKIVDIAARGETQNAERGTEPYNVHLPDLAHALLVSKKFTEHEFRMNGRGEVICPGCGAGMPRAEKQEHLSEHFVCPRSGLSFYGDAEGLLLCLHPAEDVAGRLCQAAN